jgi:hypothetical protein
MLTCSTLTGGGFIVFLFTIAVLPFSIMTFLARFITKKKDTLLRGIFFCFANAHTVVISLFQQYKYHLSAHVPISIA